MERKQTTIRLKREISTKELFLIPLNSEQGSTLAVILFVSLAIFAIAMAITFSVQSRIDIATEVSHRTTVDLELYSAVNDVIYNILTATFTQTGMEMRGEDGGVVKKWNLYGKSIELAEGVNIKLKDLSGMVSILYGTKHLKELLAYTSKDSEKVNAFVDGLVDWQDKNDFKMLNGAEAFDYRAAGYPYTPRNFYVQTSGEVMLLKGFDKTIFEKIFDDITYWGTGSYNYLTMSENILKALIKDNLKVDKIIQLRNEGKLTSANFMSMTGIQQSEVNTFSSNGLINIEVTARKGKTVGKIHAVVAKRQLEEKPFVVMEWNR